MKNTIKLGIATAMILSSAAYANETTDIEALKQEVKELRQRLARIEGKCIMKIYRFFFGER